MCSTRPNTKRHLYSAPGSIFIIPVFIATVNHRTRELQRKAVVREEVLGHGLRPIPAPELRVLANRVYEIGSPNSPKSAREELVDERVERAFSLRVAGCEAFFYERCYGSFVYEDEGYNPIRAYLVLGPGALHLLAVSKGVFGEPADPVDFPEDALFSKKFWVEGRDKESVRRLLGPELRSFLLTHGKDSAFRAGPQGVALVKHGELTVMEASELAAILKALAPAFEAAARRLRW